ncbi:MAG: hypothetical protein OXH52_11630 [Gammaproteobacteria bacterium]|nr:hypothetical protein [Gammaproteobacteria bacterium]
MPNKIVLGLIVLAALVEGLAPGAVPENILPLALVVLGIVAAVMNDDGHPTAALVAAIAAAAAGGGDVLDNVHVIGGYLDGILDALVIALLSGAAASVGMGIYNQLTASDDSE